MSEEDDDDAKNKMVNSWDEENLCPNKGRRGRKKGGQKLLRSEGNATKANGERNHGGVIVCAKQCRVCLLSLNVAFRRGTGDSGQRASSEFCQDEGQTEQYSHTEQ